MQKLNLEAGRAAYEWIREYGIRPQDTRAVVAAAGGPKWFTTFGLVRHIMSDFLKRATHEIDFLGSSVGSWQMTTALTSDPGRALDRLREAYGGHIYSEQPDASEISAACRSIIQTMLGTEHEHILQHNSRNLHVVTTRGKGLLSKDSKAALMSGFGATYLINKINRTLLNRTVERVIFSSDLTLPYHIDRDPLYTAQVSLTDKNLLPALHASGAIPMMMRPIINPPDGPRGTYWDGGVTDYHISLPYHYSDGIVLHPHFGSRVSPGWFDKKGPMKRVASSNHMDRVLLIYPSTSFVDSLPKKKISDLQDFYEFGTDQQARIEYWQEISNRSYELAQEFADFISLGPEVVKYVRLYQN